MICVVAGMGHAQLKSARIYWKLILRPSAQRLVDFWPFFLGNFLHVFGTVLFEVGESDLAAEFDFLAFVREHVRIAHAAKLFAIGD